MDYRRIIARTTRPGSIFACGPERIVLLYSIYERE